MRLARVIVVAVALAALASAAEARAEWPVYGHDLSNTRSAGGDGPSTAQVASMKQAWAFNSSNGDFTGTPVVAGGVLVAGTNLGTIYALDAVTGKLRWSHDVGQPINGSAAIDLDAPGGATAYVPIAQLGAPRLMALSLATGALRWDATLTRQDGADVFGSPTFWGGTVYIGSSGQGNDESTARGSVVALDEANGKIRWQTFTVPAGHDGGAVWSTPAIDTATGRLYVGTGNAYHEPAADTTDAMLALSAANGQILGHFQSTPGDVWEADAPFGGPDYDFGASPNLITAPDGRALIGEGQKSGTYWALDRASMQPVWRTMPGPGSQADGGVNSSAYDGARIYGSDAIDGQVFALARDGLVQWNSDDGGPGEFSPVAIGNGVLYSGNANGFVTARDVATGAVLTKLPLGAPTFGGISVVGRAVYVAVGTGPPSPAQPVPGVDTSQLDGSGSIVAFGDTSASGAKAPPAAHRVARPRNAFRLAVAPTNVRPGDNVRFRFRAVRGSHPLRGVAVRLAGHRVRTNSHGRATMDVRLGRDGTYVVEAWRRGVGKATTSVEARQEKGGEQSAPAPKGALTFDGSCAFAGTVTFTPPLTNSSQDVKQDVAAKGTCTGTLTDPAGRSHQLSDAPVTYQSTANAKGISCGDGLNSGDGALGFDLGQLAFHFDERRVTGFPLLQYTGKKGGSAVGAGGPAQDQDPTVAVQCAGAGMKTFKLQGRLQTTSQISG